MGKPRKIAADFDWLDIVRLVIDRRFHEKNPSIDVRISSGTRCRLFAPNAPIMKPKFRNRFNHWLLKCFFVTPTNTSAAFLYFFAARA